MDLKERIKTLLQEADLYRSMGLLNEAMGKYNNAVEVVQNSQQIKNKQKLLNGISKRINLLENDMDKVEKATSTPQVSEQIQNLIKDKFSFSTDDETAAIEGAIALAKFGQFERALKEFNELIKIDSQRVVAAKNVIRCHIALSTIDDAVFQYEQWFSSDIFKSDQLNNIRIFFQSILEKKGLDKTLSQAQKPIDDEKYEVEDGSIREDEMSEEEEVLDINSIGLTLAQGEMIELEVSFQSGKELTILIAKNDKELIDNFKVGDTLNDVQFYSPIAMFGGQGVISAKTMIESGPRRGDYNLDIRIEME